MSNGRRILVFSSDESLKILARARTILGDGTFRVTPSLWYQTFIISAEVDEAVFVPVMFALLPDKRQTTYEDMFGIIKDCLNSRSAELFMSDFEVGIRNGFSLHFPEVAVKGCHFHMAKAFWKRVVNKGFKTVYSDSKNHPKFGGFIRACIGIAYCPLNRLSEALEGFKFLAN